MKARMTCDIYQNQKAYNSLAFQLHHAARESKILNCAHFSASEFSRSIFLVHTKLVGDCIPLHWEVQMMYLYLIYVIIFDII